MLIESFRVKNYKSIKDSEEIQLGTGFNVVVGKNNSGKSALLKVFGDFHSNPHRSELTAPEIWTALPSKSIVEMSFLVSRAELAALIQVLGSWIVMPATRSSDGHRLANLLQIELAAKDGIRGRLTLIDGKIYRIEALGCAVEENKKSPKWNVKIDENLSLEDYADRPSANAEFTNTIVYYIGQLVR